MANTLIRFDAYYKQTTGMQSNYMVLAFRQHMTRFVIILSYLIARAAFDVYLFSMI